MKRPTLARTTWLGWIRLWVWNFVQKAGIILGSGFLLGVFFIREPPANWHPGLVIALAMAFGTTNWMWKRERTAFRNARRLHRSACKGISVRAGEEGRVVAKIPAGTLAGSDLSGSQLEEASFWGVDLRSADFSHSKLRGAWFREVIASDAIFRGANLNGAMLERADLRGADLRGANLRGAFLQGADLTGALYSTSTRWPAFFNPRARGCILVENDRDQLPIPSVPASLQPGTLPVVNSAGYQDAEVVPMGFLVVRPAGARYGQSRAATAKGNSVSHSVFAISIIAVAKQWGVCFLRLLGCCLLASWTMGLLFHVKQPSSFLMVAMGAVYASILTLPLWVSRWHAFRNARRIQSNEGNEVLLRAGEAGRIVAQIPGDTLAGRSVAGSRLSGVSLWGADLRSTDLTDTDLRHAWLTAANAAGTRFSGADLRAADLSGADFREADFRGADLREAQMWGADLNGVLYDRQTCWPNGFNPNARGCILAEVETRSEACLPIPSEPNLEVAHLPMPATEGPIGEQRLEVRG